MMQGMMLTFGERFGYFSQVILELVTNFTCHVGCHVGSHVVRVPVPAVLLAVHTQVGSQQR